MSLTAELKSQNTGEGGITLGAKTTGRRSRAARSPIASSGCPTAISPRSPTIARRATPRSRAPSCAIALLQTVGDDQVVDDGAVWNGLAVPLASDRLGIDAERRILRADSWPADIGRQWPLWYNHHRSPVWVAEARAVVGIKLDGIAVLMNKMMVRTT